MAEKAQYEELMRQLGAVGSVRRELDRILPDGCSSGSAMVLTLLGRHGDMRIGRLTELLAVDMSVTSRHVTHLAVLGWIDRSADPADRRSRILRLTPEGRARLAELTDRCARLLAGRLSGWSEEDVRRLTWLLARLRASFDDLAAGRGPEDGPAAGRGRGDGLRARRAAAAETPERTPSGGDPVPRTPAVTT